MVLRRPVPLQGKAYGARAEGKSRNSTIMPHNVMNKPVGVVTK